MVKFVVQNRLKFKIEKLHIIEQHSSSDKHNDPMGIHVLFIGVHLIPNFTQKKMFTNQ